MPKKTSDIKTGQLAPVGPSGKYSDEQIAKQNDPSNKKKAIPKKMAAKKKK